MPTIMTHAVVGAALASAVRTPRRGLVLAVGAGLAMLPDVDVVGFALGAFADSIWNHRGITHSVFAACVIGLAAGLATSRPLGVAWWKLAAWFAVITASHGVLDAFTNGGFGIAFGAPFSAERYFFAWTPIEVSPLGLGILSRRGVSVLASEARFVVLPAVVILIAVRVARRAMRARLAV